MQCFICVTYMIILCSAHPAKDKQIAAPHQKKSLFRDVIESLRIRAQLPEDFNQNEDNNLSQNYDKYGYDNEPPHLPSDADFIPRRNDRIEMPTLPLKYRFPKSLNDTEEKVVNVTTEEIVLFVDTDKITKTTQKPKKQKRPPTSNKNKVVNKNKENEDQEEETQTPLQDNMTPVSNTLSGNSQIGNRESQTVVKPTVIVNFRGSLTHQDSDIRLEKRNDNDTDRTAQNIFNINQEVNFEPVKKDGKKGSKPKVGDVKQTFNIVTDVKAKVEEDMLMCETATWNPKRNVREGRKRDNVLQILFSL
ncbi:uncharacterized protein LOC114353135 [Ostrinia furnacalis]|uniref:uncharacterized protein LOC114353135 n=1 Tax=Ostrinia furnacalis TaxID=93504 RepID=UPI00103AF29F|nr:uncharacterized protein LOC114353135 [Ostrinia furnacalis]